MFDFVVQIAQNNNFFVSEEKILTFREHSS